MAAYSAFFAPLAVKPTFTVSLARRLRAAVGVLGARDALRRGPGTIDEVGARLSSRAGQHRPDPTTCGLNRWVFAARERSLVEPSRAHLRPERAFKCAQSLTT
jgi:hypothetical protein